MNGPLLPTLKGVLPENRCAKLRPPLEFELVAAPAESSGDFNKTSLGVFQLVTATVTACVVLKSSVLTANAYHKVWNITLSGLATKY